MNVLVINCGSSSVKFQVVDVEKEKTLIKGRVDSIGLKHSFLEINSKEKFPQKVANHEAAMKVILNVVKEYKLSAIGHRVVHGGEYYNKAVVINATVMKRIKELSALAPLHNPHNLTGINACKKAMPKLKQVAVFDTAFHQTMPEEAYLYGIPYEFYKKDGIRKYGFHGTSHEFIALECKKLIKKKKLNLITCHVGGGVSVACIKDGKSIDTTMGMTPLAGPMMGTRCGDLDPSIVGVMSKKMSLNKVYEILNKGSGFLGISGHQDSRDFRSKAIRGCKKSQRALDIFSYDMASYIAQYYGILGNVDAIVFTAGVGEHEPHMRQIIIERLNDFGIFLDSKKNWANKTLISSKKSKCKIFMIPTNEELMIAKEAKAVLNRKR